MQADCAEVLQHEIGMMVPATCSSCMYGAAVAVTAAGRKADVKAM
jgi:hypothetical protein